MEQIGDAFWNFAWAFVDVLEAILIWLQGVLGELYTLVCELFKIRFQFRILSHTIMLPIAMTLLIVSIVGRFAVKAVRRRRRKRIKRF